ncbi:hypothetical protein RJ640_010568 [Escallonia rubra]|uniref:Pentatricopeptide repeat-containing protein n=1 Tax=Escallonia rubra TaxID=112253 RepID=A0AA88S9Y4_9ASTE|nr:hypothetical protein RJ640_010568 [Escallonia rubra]
MERHLTNLLHSTLHINQFKQVHALIVRNHHNLIPLFTKKLLSLSFVEHARKVFDEIPQPDQTVYNTFISAYSRLTWDKEAIQVFVLMRDKALVNFYAKTGGIHAAKRVFDETLVKDPICYNCLISGYSKSGDVLTARRLFDQMANRTLVSWNSMLSCYAHNGNYLEGFRTFEQMQAEKCRANEFTVVTVLSICAKLGNLEMGLRVKKFIDDNKLCFNIVVSTALLEMYVKCGAVDDARLEFDRMVERDVVAWSAMISGYAQNGRSSDALELFEEMEGENIKPNDVTIVSVLSACAQLGSVEAGERIGTYVESRGLDSNLYLASALLSMYSRCGNIERACQVFKKMPQRDVVTWNSMITGLAINGFAEDAVAHYGKMKEVDVKPDESTFVGLLTACTHAGLLDLGLEYFKTMRLEYGISPKIEHYACIVDLFCRSGQLVQAYDFICKMEVEPNAVIWGNLLSASRIHSNVEIAEIAVNKLLELEPENSGSYVLLSNIYASVGRWQEALKVRSLMRIKNIQKTAAYSWIELEEKVHKFLVGDITHPRREDVYSTIDWLAMHSSWTYCELDSDLEIEAY